MGGGGAQQGQKLAVVWELAPCIFLLREMAEKQDDTTGAGWMVRGDFSAIVLHLFSLGFSPSFQVSP